jgi:hypothetical protein
MSKLLSSGLLVLLLVAVTAGRAEAHAVHFLGPHPIAAKYGGGFCLIEAPHLHIYPPDHPNLYQKVGDQMVFTADPTPFGYEGEKHAFYGHHPVVTVGGETVMCYLDGPHYHPFPAPDVPDYEIKKGVAFYVGAFPPSYEKMRPARARAINAEYRPYVALRPTIEVTPPERWHGEVWVSPPAVVAPGLVVGAPGVIVSAPGLAVVAPVPPTVVVGAPGFVGGVYRDDRRHLERHDERHDERGHWGEEHEHHDNGKHNGWFEHGGHGHR